MLPAGRLALCGLALAAGSVAALAQSVISARSGLIHYVEGQVYLDRQPVDSKFGNFPEVKENSQLRTEEGRAEVLLTPGVFLRLGENTSFRMITNRLIDTRLEVLNGSAIVEAEDIHKDNSVTLVYKDATVHPFKKGLYRLDATSGALRVFAGVAEVAANDKTIEVKEGHSIDLDTLAVARFDKDSTDALNRWSQRRDEYVSMANVSAANSLRSSMFGGGMLNSGWYWNPFFGMFTFVPGLDGDWMSPYGFRFWSPFDVYMAFMPGYYYWPSGYGTPVYGNVYNGVLTNSVPSPSRYPGAVGKGGLAGLGHVPAGGSPSAVSSSRGTFSGTASSTTPPIAISHGASGGGGGTASHH